MGICFQEVTFTYNPHKNKVKDINVLENINLNINKNNEFIAIVGHTGSGKSTITQLMNGLLLKTDGEISVDDININDKTSKRIKEVRRKVGLVFQFPEYQLFEDTVLKDVCFGPKNFKLDNPKESAIKALKLFNLEGDFLEKNPLMLSGGEMRKVSISGILASDPEVLILDEPTVGLDPKTKKELLKILKSISINEKKTIIIVTHDMDVVWDVATRIILLDDKKIVFDGPKKDLFEDIDFLHQHSLDLPELVKAMIYLKDKLNLNIDVYKDNVEDCLLEIIRGINHE